jgi:hypothetical protein
MKSLIVFVIDTVESRKAPGKLNSIRRRNVSAAGETYRRVGDGAGRRILFIRITVGANSSFGFLGRSGDITDRGHSGAYADTPIRRYADTFPSTRPQKMF